MKIIVLAAGMGSRLGLGNKSKFSFSIPFLFTEHLFKVVKALEENYTQDLDFISEEFLIENLFKNINRLNLMKEFLFVLGYKFLEVTPILSYLAQKYGEKINYVVNPWFEDTNTAYSLLLAIKSIINSAYDDDILIFNGDNYLSKDAWTKVMMSLPSGKSFVVVDRASALTEESFKVKIDQTGKQILDMGKDLCLEESTGEFIGVSFVVKRDLPLFLDILENLVENDKKSYYDLAFIPLSQKGKIDYVFLDGELWTEIDFLEDIKKLVKILLKDSL